MVLNEFISAFLQLLVFMAIPFLVYLAQTRGVKGFSGYIGFKRTTKKAVYLSLLTSLVFLAGALAVVALDESIRSVMTSPPSVTGKIRALGLSGESVTILLVIACVKTSLAEEILFRGFLAKRLMHWLGYQKGNLWQALIFALIHALLFWSFSKAGVFFLVFIFVFSGLAAYIIGYIKEKTGNGSIIPGWIAHALGNTLSYFIIAFVM